jgi:hypothetical protein
MKRQLELWPKPQPMVVPPVKYDFTIMIWRWPEDDLGGERLDDNNVEV